MNNIDFLYKTTEVFHQLSQLTKISYIKKLPSGKFRVYSQDGKNLGTYSSRKQAEKRLKQVEYFKYLNKLKKEAGKKLDLSEIEAFTYSSIMRQINKQLDHKAAKLFAKTYKDFFDKLYVKKDSNIEKNSLIHTVKLFHKKYPIIIDDKIIKLATASLGDSQTVAKYLSNIIKFTLNKISPERRPHSTQNVKQKILALNEKEIASKKMPASSSMGQSITFLKHILFGQDPQYVRSVLNDVVRFL